MMDSNFNLTDTEHSMLETARQLLGDNLSDFLLSGLGETQVSRRRAFTGQIISPHVDARVYQLEMVSESKQGLPIGRDPLVLAALLDLLCERQPLDSTILFRQGDILEKLGWNDTAESRSLIKRALERYAFTAYCLVDPTLTEKESAGSRYAGVGRLLIGYEMASPHYPLKKRRQPKFATSGYLFACAHFLPGLIHDVISERKSFLGIDFQALEFVPGKKKMERS